MRLHPEIVKAVGQVPAGLEWNDSMEAYVDEDGGVHLDGEDNDGVLTCMCQWKAPAGEGTKTQEDFFMAHLGMAPDWMILPEPKVQIVRRHG